MSAPFDFHVIADRTVVEGFAVTTRFGVVTGKPVKSKPFEVRVPSGSIKLLSVKATNLFPPVK